MKDIRIRFKKCGRAKYISHLDLARTMTRAIRRAGIPVWYTEGFNRHPYLTFAAPLSLGFEGLKESMDVRLVEDISMNELVSRLNDVLPEGLEVYSAGEPILKAGEIDKAKYRLTFTGDTESFDKFVSQDSITVEKRSKKGALRRLELKPYLEQAAIDKKEDGIRVIEITLPCSSSETVNPMLILSAYQSCPGSEPLPVFCKVLRLDLLDSKNNPFQ